MPTFTITKRNGDNFTVQYDEEDTELLAQYKWYIDSNGYCRTSFSLSDRKTMGALMHRVIMSDLYGSGFTKKIDHKNGIRTDNSRGNIRVCTNVENSQNRCCAKNNSSGFKGVHLCTVRGKFRARIKYKEKNIHLGHFVTALEAAKAYNAAAKNLYGEFARLNALPG